MRENRTSGSEGGEAQLNAPFLPLSKSKVDLRRLNQSAQADFARVSGEFQLHAPIEMAYPI